MKKYLSLLFFYCLFSAEGKAQFNLVPNGGFENYTSCPSTLMQINYAFPWTDPNMSSSDYNNTCNQTVPCLAGCLLYQFPHSGDGYAAIECMFGLGGNFREYIQVPLIDSLLNNHCYYVEFYVNKANSDKYVVNNIGAYLSNTAIASFYTTPYNLTAQILLPGNPVITDTVNWVKVYGNYTALGGEKYLTIGNFQDDANTNILVFDSTSQYDAAYYYIDDVSVIDCTNQAVPELSTTNNLQISPNPATSTITIETKNTILKSIHIYNVVGCEMLNQVQHDERVTIDISSFSNGIYFVEVLSEKGIQRQKLVKQ